MSTHVIAAKMTPMTRVERGKRLENWARGQRGRIQQLADIAEVSRTTVETAFKGTAAARTYDKLESAREYIENHPEDVAPGPEYVARAESGHIIEFEVTADAVGLKVFVRGPIENGDELSAQAAKVFAEIQKNMGNAGQAAMGNQD